MNAHDFLVPREGGVLRVRLTSWDEEIRFDRVKIEVAAPTKDDFARGWASDYEGMNKMLKYLEAQPRRRKRG